VASFWVLDIFRSRHFYEVYFKSRKRMTEVHIPGNSYLI